jgi:type IV pilus assembly protein PilP
MPKTRVTSCLLALALALVLASCDDSDPNAVLSPGAAPPSPPRVQPGAIAPSAAPASAQVSAPSERAYRDSDFVESEQNRDPFRSYAIELRAKAPVVAQRMVLMPETAVDDMRLIAIISGVEQPRAMIVDAAGVGYTASRGDFLGKAEVVQGPGADALPVALNWRVERIRENELVLAREDPSAPGRAPLTKVIALHEDDPSASKLLRGRDNG